jgi:hypothetical protein
MTDLITEARELIEALHAGAYDDEYIGTDAYLMLDELCDALEKAEEQIESVHKALDFAETQRQRSKNYTELAINNGLALGRIAVILQHDFEPLPAQPEEGEGK